MEMETSRLITANNINAEIDRQNRGAGNLQGVKIRGACLLLLFLLPSDNVQHDLQHGSLITFPKEENLGNKKKFYCSIWTDVSLWINI